MSTATSAAVPPARRRLVLARDVALVALLVYGFLVAVGLLASAMDVLGRHAGDGLADGLAHPLVALSMGMLATLVLQSSSVTTSVCVAVGAAVGLPAATAVPLVLGANVGATLANALVSLGAARRSSEFQRAFACASLHDLFNVCAAVVLLPLELATGWISRAAGWLAGRFVDVDAASEPAEPVAGLVSDGVGVVREALEGVGAHGTLLAILLLVIGTGLIHQLLQALSITMQRLLRGPTAASLTRVVLGDRFGALGFGVVAALAVQSSVVTTALLVPLVSAGVLGLSAAYPVIVGANLGTTLTPLLASLAVSGPAGLVVALVHVLVNVAAALLFFALPPLRTLPLALAGRLGGLAARRRAALIVGLLVVFVALPLAGMLGLR